MKKILFLAMLLLIVAGNGLLAQTRYLKFRVVDALGNSDTVTIMEKQGATEELDTELGEINLFGVQPQGDLDLRIIQRTDTTWLNYYVDSNTQNPYWLVGDTVPAWEDDSWEYCCSGIFIKTFKSNLDLKTDYRPKLTHRDAFALQVYAKNYPITIQYWRFNNYHYNLPKDGYLYFSDFDNETRTQHHLAKYPNGINSFPPWYYTDDAPAYNIYEDILYMENESQNGIIGFGITCEECVNAIINPIIKTLYPNPSSDVIVLDEGTINKKYSIFSIEGELIKSFEITELPYLLDISNFQTGSYFIKNELNNTTYQFIKNKE
jgi:hypothetical protein